MDQLTSRQRQLLAWMTELADIGEPCPANSAICKRLGIQGDDANATHALKALEKRGLITIEASGATSSRVRIVTIVATGKSTARPKVRAIETPRPIPPVRTGEARAASTARPVDRTDEIRAIVARQKALATPAAPAAQREPPAPDPEPIAPPPVAIEPAPAPQPEEPSMPITPLPTHGAAIAAPSPPAPLNPFTASVEVEDGMAMLTVHLRLDPGPGRAVREFLRVPIDEMHLLELLSTSALSLRKLREARS